jgi:hypothetical protein
VKRKTNTGRVPDSLSEKKKQKKKSYPDRTSDADQNDVLAGPEDNAGLRLMITKLKGRREVDARENDHLTTANFELKTEFDNYKDLLEKEKEKREADSIYYRQQQEKADAGCAAEVERAQNAEKETCNLAGQVKQLERMIPQGETLASLENESEGGNADRPEQGLTASSSGDGQVLPQNIEKNNTTPASNPRIGELKKLAVKIPTLQAWDNVSRNEEDRIIVFLPRLAQYLDIQGIKREDRLDHVFSFLKGKAFQLWQLESRSITDANEKPTWEHFEKFMKDSFGVTAPERHARKQYDRLTQTGNVFKYVQETKRLVQQMRPMPMICPGEADIVHKFIQNARPLLKDWLVTHTPAAYWESTQQVFKKAIEFGTNQDPAVTRSVTGRKLLGAMSGHPHRSGRNQSKPRSFNRAA